MHRIAKYFVTFTVKCFVQAAAAISAELRAILLNKICKILQFLRKILGVQNRTILTSLLLKTYTA